MTSDDTELRRYYGLMDVFVHAAEKGESFGMVLCEAMLSGLPVITLNTPLRDNSQIEVVPHGKAGFVVNSLKQTIDAMLACANDSVRFQEMGRKAPIWVQESFDIPVVTRKLLAIAPIALAATSSHELAQRLSEAKLMTEAPPNLYRELFAAAGVNPSFRQRVLTSWINRPVSRRAIYVLRSFQSHLRGLLKGT